MRSQMIIDVVIPQAGESILEATIASWSVENKSFVEKNQVLVVLETNKASLEVVADKAGEIEIFAQEDETLEIGKLIARIDTNKAKTKVLQKKEKAEKVTNKQDFELPEELETVNASSPAATKILAEKNVSPNDVKGTGKQGRITKADALNAQEKSVELSNITKASSNNTSTKSLVMGTTTRKKMSPLRKTIAQRLVQAQHTTAMLTTFNEVDMSAIMETRKKFKETFKDTHNVNLGFMSFFAKASCLSLKKFPLVNSQIEGEELVTYSDVNLSVAVSTNRGLVVPVIKGIDQMKLHEIEQSIIDVAVKARDLKLSPDDMIGGTFTITNGGIFGSMLSTPIINTPQSAILGMHNIVERPVVVNGEIVIRPIMYLALSYDHRIIDGKEAVSFLVNVKNYLEEPTRLLLEV